MLFSLNHPKQSEKIKILEKELEKLQKKIKEHEEALQVASDMLKKTSSMINDIALLQSNHLEHTAMIHEEVQTVLNALYPKDNIKYDLMNEPYN